ncbi:MAG TPA: hypothetical protein VGR32_12960 [Brevundimonas sp.]|uniref:hypothetical protein n=1 Tax=Brevundimonas sp. TaxID=1871086 RepID=UPI002DF366B0|nr:hypothetical protein [Brevundimonas sp.]
MKHAVLTSVGHNISDSLSCGMGFLIGLYETDVFAEAASNPDGFIEVDFLTGTSVGQVSPSLAKAISLYAQALPRLCQKQGVAVADFDRLITRYVGKGEHHFIVEVTDRRGRTSRDRYVGQAARRPKVIDQLGRVRRLKSA